MKRETLIPILKLIPKKIYTHTMYFLKFKKILNIKKPKTFNEKINRTKLSNQDQLLARLADKYEVKKFVKEKVGEKYLAKTYGIFESTKKINFEKMPEKFCLKATHGSGWNIICKNKHELNKKKTISTLNKWLKWNYYHLGKESQYKQIKPRIICEEYLEDSNKELIDYKFFCFNGKPLLVQLDIDRKQNHKRCFYDMNWNKQNFTLHFPFFKKKCEKPKKFKEMINVAKKLSKDFKFVRVDLYNIDGEIKFGEMTFTPGNGFEKFKPTKYDLKLGQLINNTKNE